MILFVAPLIEEPELLEEVANIGKDAAEEAAKIAATEEQAARDIQKPLEEAEKAPGSASGSGVVIEEKIPL